jgi:pyrimidine deaminase RibD-like protein
MNAPIRVAERLAVRKARHRQHKHAVLIFVGRRVIATGWNSATKHAEIHALEQAGEAAKGADVLSIRVRIRGEWGLAKPCPECQEALRKAGVRRVQYSTSDGAILEMNRS